MLLPLRKLAEDRPGRLVLITFAALTACAVLAAVVTLQSGATLATAARSALITYFAGSMLLSAPSMLVGALLAIVPSVRNLGFSFVFYGASMGVVGFTALALL